MTLSDDTFRDDRFLYVMSEKCTRWHIPDVVREVDREYRAHALVSRSLPQRSPPFLPLNDLHHDPSLPVEMLMDSAWSWEFSVRS